MAADVRRYFLNEPVAAGPPGATYRLQKMWKRHKVLFGAAGAVLGTLLLGLGVATGQYLRAEGARRHALSMLYVAHMSLIGQYWDSANITSMQQLLSEHGPKKDGDDLRGFEWFYYWRLAHQERFTLRLADGDLATAVGFSRSAAVIATAGAGDSLAFWDVNSGRATRHIPLPSTGGRARALSPDLRTVIKEEEAEATLWDVDSGKLTATLKGHIDAASFSPDGRAVATGGEDREVRLWSASDGRPTATWTGYPGRVAALAFSPDGRTLAVGTTEGRVTLSSTAGGKSLATLAASLVYDITSLAFSPDGRWLAATGQGTGALVVWDVAARKELVRPKGHTGPVMCVAFFPDGKRMVTGSYDRTAIVWEVETGRPLSVIKGHGHSIDAVAVSDDGSTLATSSRDSTVKLWSTDAVRTPQLVHPSSLVKSMSISRDGKRIATAARGYQGARWAVRLWDAATRNLITTLAEDEERGSSVAFSPDGRYLAAADLVGVIRFWDAETSRLDQTITLGSAGEPIRLEPDYERSLRCRGWCFPRMGEAWARLSATTRCACGISRRGGRAQRSRDIRQSSRVWRFRRTAQRWRRGAATGTGRRASGTRGPGRN